MLALRGTEYARPASIRVLPSALEAAPDAAAWASALGVPVEIGERWDWRRAAGDTGPSLLRFGSRWRAYAGIGNRLKPAMWIVLIALAVHGVALGVDWVRLAREQRDLRLRLETRFRALFPEAVAVADPVLQMRRKLAEARHAGGQADDSD